MMSTPPHTATGLTFPCDFVIKIVGKASDEFEIGVLAIIHQHFPRLTEGAIETRLSGSSKYMALTVKLHVTSQEELDNIYRDLSASPLVIMAL